MSDATHLMERVHGADWPAVPAEVRRSHTWTQRLVMTGNAQIERGDGRWGKFIGWFFAFPAANPMVQCRIEKQHLSNGREKWTRFFDQQKMTSVLHEKSGKAFERFGPVTFQLGIKLNQRYEVEYPVKRAMVGPLALPQWFLPVSVAREFENNGRYSFDVEIRAPITKELVVRYRGTLEF